MSDSIHPLLMIINSIKLSTLFLYLLNYVNSTDTPKVDITNMPVNNKQSVISTCHALRAVLGHDGNIGQWKVHCHVEVWNGKNLVGGLYGVDIAGYFAGESMFHREDNASKAAIVFVIALLKKVGRTWMDIQVLTPHMKVLGATEITRRKFLGMLESAKESQKLGTGLKPFNHEEVQEKYTYNNFSMFMEKDNSSAIKKTPL